MICIRQIIKKMLTLLNSANPIFLKYYEIIDFARTSKCNQPCDKQRKQ